MSNNDYYTKEEIERRVYGSLSSQGERYGKHEYRRPDDFAEEIMAAAAVGDHDFLLRVVHVLTRRLQQQSYEKGIEDTKASFRAKLGL
jgi:hypothetical protein